MYSIYIRYVYIYIYVCVCVCVGALPGGDKRANNEAKQDTQTQMTRSGQGPGKAEKKGPKARTRRRGQAWTPRPPDKD